MKFVPRMPIPWDMVVFLTITTAGFGYSVRRLFTETSFGIAPSVLRDVASASHVPNGGTADLGCIEESLPTQKLSSDLGTIRLRGKLCQLSSRALKSFEGVQIRNLTNGYEGTVFIREQDGSFVTDYLVLARGANEIEILWREKPNKEPRRILAEITEL